MPHGLTVDDKDNIWCTDVGMHQVRPARYDITAAVQLTGSQ